MFIDLDMEGLPTSDSVNVLDPEVTEIESTYRWGPGRLGTSENWRDSQVDDNIILVLISSPRGNPGPIIIWWSMGYPIEEDSEC